MHLSGHSPQPVGQRRARLVVLLAVLFLAWALRLYLLGAHSLQYEEGYAVYISSLNLAETLAWSSRDLLPPLQSFLLVGWLALGGQSEFSARFLSAAAGMLSVAVFVRLGREQSWLVGLLAGHLAALSPFYVWHSQHARMYALLALFGLAATLVLIRALRDPSRKRLWVAFAVLEALALYTQTATVFLILFHALAIVYVGVWSENSTIWKRGGSALAGAVLAWLPWLLYALPFFGENTGFWPGRLNATLVVSESFQAFVGGQMMGPTTRIIAVVAWGLGCLFGAVMLALHRKWGRAAFLFGWLVVPIVIMAILFRRLPKFEPRYLILASPPIILLSTLGVDMGVRRPGGWRFLAGLALVAMVTVSGIGLSNLYFVPEFEGADFRAAARMVRDRIGPEDGVILVPGYAFPAWGYYYDSGEWVRLPDDPILDVRHVLHYSDVAPRVNEWLGHYSGVWLVQWDSDIVDPTGIVPYLLGQVGREIPMAGAMPNGISVAYYRFDDGQVSLPVTPVVSTPRSQELYLPLRLIGCDVGRVSEGLDVACYWQAEGNLPDPLAVSVRLFDDPVNLLAVEDGPIAAGRWPGRPVLARHFLPCQDLSPGPHWLSLAVYDYEGNEYGVALIGLLAYPPATAVPVVP